jgi:hypothetical protein
MQPLAVNRIVKKHLALKSLRARFAQAYALRVRDAAGMQIRSADRKPQVNQSSLFRHANIFVGTNHALLED